MSELSAFLVLAFVGLLGFALTRARPRPVRSRATVGWVVAVVMAAAAAVMIHGLSQKPLIAASGMPLVAHQAPPR